MPNIWQIKMHWHSKTEIKKKENWEVYTIFIFFVINSHFDFKVRVCGFPTSDGCETWGSMSTKDEKPFIHIDNLKADHEYSISVAGTNSAGKNGHFLYKNSRKIWP